MKAISQNKRDQLIIDAKAHNTTLNGKRAFIMGRYLDYAIIGVVDSPLQVEFSWSAVVRVMSANRAFIA